MLHPDLFVLYSPGMASIVMLRSKASTFALWMMLMTTATLNLCQALVAKWGMSVLHRSQIPAHATHISLDSVMRECSQTLLTLHTQPFYGSVNFVRDNPCEPVPEETFTHSHLSWSSIIPICFLHLLQSMASSSDTTGWNIPKTATHFTSSNDRSYCSEHCLGKRSGSCQRMLTNHNFV